MQANVTVDTRRIVGCADAVSADTSREVCYSATARGDTNRTIYASVNIPIDTSRRLAKQITGLKSLSMTLSSKTICDTFSAETFDPLAINDSITGMLLGMPYSFLVEETSQQTDMQSITGMYDRDKLLGEFMTYTPGSAASAETHLEGIAYALGKTLVHRFDNFVPSNMSSTSITYRDAISTLFGWTSRLPQRQVNVFMRGSTMYVIQRGKEIGTQTVASPYTRPTIKRKIIRSLIGTEASNTLLSYVVEPMPFSGTISFGDQSASYSGGLLVNETHTTDGTSESTSYSYSGGYLVQKITSGGKYTIEVEYEYGGIHTPYLAVETQITYDKDGNKSKTEIIRHVPAGHGWFGTTVEVDDETISSTLSKGAPGGKASIYSINDANRSLGGGYAGGGSGNNSGPGLLPGRATIDTSFPTKDAGMLVDLTAAVIWLNGKTEERVTMDVYDAPVFDFMNTVTYAGNVYYLEKNTLSKDPKIEKQSIEIVRWY